MAGTADTFDLGRFSGQCAHTGSAIAAGEAFIAALVEGADEAGRPLLRRADFSCGAWESGARPERLMCFWRSTAPQAGERRTMLVDDETLMEMVQRDESDTDPRRCAFRWILALVLLRRKMLRLDGIMQENGAETWSFLRRGAVEGETPLRIVNPKIRDEEVSELSEQLGAILRADA